MPKISRELTVLEVRKLGQGTFAVGGARGLYLRKSPKQSFFFLRYSNATGRHDLSLGSYPETSLAEARKLAVLARIEIDAGECPVTKRKQASEALREKRSSQQRIQTDHSNTFEKVARTWIKERVESGFWANNKRGESNTVRLLEMYAFPLIGNIPFQKVPSKRLSSSKQIAFAISSLFIKEISMKIQTGTNINCKPQTTFALSGIACFIAFLLSGTFAVAAPAPSVQPQKPDIRFGTDPVRPTDLESTTGFVDRTPRLFGSKVTLKTSIEDFDKDSILNYSKDSWDKKPIYFTLPNASLTFKKHKLRILAPCMTGGSAIEAEGSKVTIDGSAFEVYASDPQYLLKSASNSSINVNVDHAWLELNTTWSNSNVLWVVNNGELNLHAEKDFFAYLTGEPSPADNAGVAWITISGSLNAKGSRYYFAGDPNFINASKTAGIRADTGASVALGAIDKPLDFLSVSGVGHGLVSDRTKKFDVWAKNLYVQTVSSSKDEFGNAIELKCGGFMNVSADNAIFRGDVKFGDGFETSQFKLSGINTLVDGNIEIDSANGTISVRELSVNGVIRNYGGSALIRTDNMRVNSVEARYGGEINIIASGFEGHVDAFLDHEFDQHTSRPSLDASFSEEEIKYIQAGKVNLSIAGDGLWVARGKNLVSKLDTDLGASIDLTRDPGSSLMVNEFAGVADVTLQLSQNADQSSMLYIGSAEAGSQLNINIQTAEGETLDDLKGVRFATVKNAPMLARLEVEDQGFFNVEVDIYNEKHNPDAEDADNIRWNGASNGTELKLGADVVNGFIGDDEAENWIIGNNSAIEISDAGQTILGTARATYWNSVMIDRWNQRYGDRVYDPNHNGVFARVKYEHVGTDDGVGDFSSRNTMYQFGYDYSLPTEAGKVVLGGAVDYMNGDTTYKAIDGDGGTDRVGLTFYSTYMGNNGSYADFVLRAGRLDNDYTMTTAAGVALSADYHNWLYGASIEVGHQFANTTGWFVEPQLQAQYTRITSTSFNTAQTDVRLDAIDSLILRAGVRGGQYFTKAKDGGSMIYAKADVMQECFGKQRFAVSDMTTPTDGFEDSIKNRGTWFDLGVGFQMKMLDQFYTFGDVEYRFGNDLEKTFVINVGAKYLF